MHRPTRFLRTAVVAAALSAGLAINASALSYGAGTVTCSALNLRAGASTSSSVLKTVAKGTTVTVLENQSNGWYKVELNGVTGYMSANYLSVTAQSSANLGTGTVNTGSTTLNLRSGPGTGYSKLASIPSKTVLTLTGISNGWYKTSYNGITGYVSSDYITLGSTVSAATSSSSSVGAQVVSYAKQFLGRPYVYGGSGPSSFDCSGFTAYVYKHFGYNLSHSATSQCSSGTAVSLSQVQPGDLILWRAYGSSSGASHAGIYIGNNQYIHASSTGGCVTINDMSYGSNLRYVVAVRRIVN